MATETLRPNDNGDLSQCCGSDYDYTNNYQLINEETANDADYVMGVSSPSVDLYNIPSTAIPAGSTINKVTFYGRFARLDYGISTGDCKFAYKSGGSTYYSSSLAETTSYSEFSWEQTTNQKTSAAWTIDDINALQIGVALYCYLAGKDYSTGRCSQLWIVIDYTEKNMEDAWLMFFMR